MKISHKKSKTQFLGFSRESSSLKISDGNDQLPLVVVKLFIISGVLALLGLLIYLYFKGVIDNETLKVAIQGISKLIEGMTSRQTYYYLKVRNKWNFKNANYINVLVRKNYYIY